jgi:hypothetical protein
MSITKYKLPASVFLIVFLLLAFVQIKVERPMILAERIFPGAGWIEIFIISCYGAYPTWHPL